MGQPKKSTKQQARGIDRSLTRGSTERTNARSTTSSAHLSDRSARLGRRPPPGELSDRKAWPKTLLPTPIPCLRPETHRKPACRSSPTGTARNDWGHPTGDARSEGTRGKWRRQCTKSNHDTGTIPCTPTGTMLLNRPNTNSIVGADICVYSIVGAIGLPYGKKPPTYLRASVVLWVPGFTISGTHGRAPLIYFVGTNIYPS